MWFVLSELNKGFNQRIVIKVQLCFLPLLIFQDNDKVLVLCFCCWSRLVKTPGFVFVLGLLGYADGVTGFTVTV